MRKTFLKVALIGLLVGSLPVGFTSCKDYDDDINNLENQTSDLKTKLASVESAIAALPSKADVTAAQAAAVAQAKADLETVKAQLEAAIANKADKSEVEAINGELSKIQGQLETLDALKADVATALEAVANITELNAELQKQGQAIAGLTAQMETLTGSLATEAENLKNDIENNKTSIEAIETKLAELADKINGEGGDATPIEASLKVLKGMITSLRFVSDWGAFATNGGTLKLYNSMKVDKVPTGPKSWYYPNGEPLLFDIEAGKQKNFVDSVLVQVSPAGAVLNADDITLVNSKKEQILDYVEISSVKPYTDLLTTSRALSNNGLYVVYFQQAPDYVADKDEKDKDGLTNFDKATKSNGKKIRFAIAMNDTQVDAERYVLTPYDLTIQGGVPTVSDELWFSVVNSKNQATDVTKIHNRFLYAADNSSYMYVEKDVNDPANNMAGVYAAAKPIVSYTAATEQGYVPVGDYMWSDIEEAEATYDGNYADGPATKGDNRTAQPYFNVNREEAFTVKMYTNSPDTPLYGYYVALDILRATESDQSERAAWLKYADNIEGLNKLYKSGDITLKILKSANVPDGDVIGFRVWAVNYDGSLVDPDGKAFYVQVGEETSKTTKAVPATFTARFGKNWDVKNTGAYSDILSWTTANATVKVTFAMENNNTEVGANKIKAYKANDESTVTVTFGNSTYSKSLTSKMNGKPVGTTPVVVNAADYAKFFSNIKVSISDAMFVDGVTYNGKITISSTTGETLQVIPVKVTKNIPTELDGISIAAGLTDAQGNINIYATVDATGSYKSTEHAATTQQAVYASLNNVFRKDNKPVVWGTDGNNEFCFALKVLDEGQDTWGKPGEPALYMNGTYKTADYGLTFVGNPNQYGVDMWEYNENGNTTSTTGNCVLEMSDIDVPTLSYVNSANAHTLTIFQLYSNASYNATYVDGVPTEEPGDDYKPCVGKGDFGIKVKTYPATYSINPIAGLSLTYTKTAYVAYDAITISSSATSQVKNMTLTTAQSVTPTYLQIETPAVTLTGDVAQYYKTPLAETSIKVDIDENGNVYNTADNAPVYGISVIKKTASDGAVSYEYSDKNFNENSVKVITLAPNTAMVNAPTGNISGKLQVSFLGAWGLGNNFHWDATKGKYVPTSIATSTNVTMQP